MLDEVIDQQGNLHKLDQEVLLQALQSLHTKEREGLMKIHMVRTLYACDTTRKHPQRTTVCCNGTISLAK
eukprot:5233477-Prorocentrum_lima.AAC.1